MSRRSNRHRTGSVYLVVLGAAMIVAVLGVSALMAVRVHRRVAEASGEVLRARFAAESIIDLAAFRIASDPNWRSAYTHDEWTPTEALGGDIGFQFKLVDERDGDLADDPSQPVRLYGRAAAGDAVRIYSVLLTPDGGPLANNSRFTNPGFEDGTTGWLGESSIDSSTSTLNTTTDGPRGGSRALRVTDRSGGAAGPAYNLVGVLENGKTHTVEMWVRVTSGTETFGFTRYMESGGSGSSSISNSTSIGTSVGQEWTLVTETFTPSWSGDLIEAYIKVRTGGGGTDFDVDDARLVVEGETETEVVSMRIEHGSWRREVVR